MELREQIDIVTLYDTKLTWHFEYITLGKQSPKLKQLSNLKKGKKYSGELGRNGKKRIYNRLTAWLHCLKVAELNKNNKNKKTKIMPVFITLTLSSSLPYGDKWIKKNMLELFIKQIQYEHNVKHYFWKAEKQKNGRLHFHLIIDRFIDKKEIQKRWNKIQQSKGYTEIYYEQHQHHNPPSTHVKAISQFDKSVNYVQKYVSKYPDGANVQGSIYRFSKGLVNIKPFSFIVTNRELPDFYNILENLSSNQYISEWFASYKFKRAQLWELMDCQIKREFYMYYDRMFLMLYCNDNRTSDVSKSILTPPISKLASNFLPDIIQFDLFKNS